MSTIPASAVVTGDVTCDGDLTIHGTVSGAVAGHEMANLWATRDGFTRRVGLYLLHPRSGADMLELAGSDPLTVAWTREHHLPEDQWTIPRDIGLVLKACDDD